MVYLLVAVLDQGVLLSSFSFLFWTCPVLHCWILVSGLGCSMTVLPNEGASMQLQKEPLLSKGKMLPLSQGSGGCRSDRSIGAIQYRIRDSACVQDDWSSWVCTECISSTDPPHRSPCWVFELLPKSSEAVRGPWSGVTWAWPGVLAMLELTVSRSPLSADTTGAGPSLWISFGLFSKRVWWLPSSQQLITKSKRAK